MNENELCKKLEQLQNAFDKYRAEHKKRIGFTNNQLNFNDDETDEGFEVLNEFRRSVFQEYFTKVMK